MSKEPKQQTQRDLLSCVDKTTTLTVRQQLSAVLELIRLKSRLRARTCAHTQTHKQTTKYNVSHTRTRTDVCEPRLHRCNATRPCLTAKISITIGWRNTTRSTNKRKVWLANSGTKGGAVGLSTPPIDPCLDIHVFASPETKLRRAVVLRRGNVACNHPIKQGRNDSRLLRTKHVQQYRRRSASGRPSLQRPRMFMLRAKHSKKRSDSWHREI